MAEPGEKLGPYLLLRRLGAGSMGEVWKARDERLGRTVALKTLPTGELASQEQRSLILREARAAAAVPHPNVVTLYDIYSADDGEDFLVMELVEGQTLQEALAEHGAMAPEAALRILTEITAALRAAHERGIIHRDIKAANVMLTEDGAVKVLDFGLAKLRESDLELVSVDAGTVEGRAVAGASTAVAAATARTITSDSGRARASGVSDTIAAQPAPAPHDDPEDSRPARASGLTDTMAAQAPPPDGPAIDATAPAATGSSSGKTGSRGASSTEPLGTVTGDFIGTPLYMSPEQVLGERPDAISEVFSVGILAHELLAGGTPYKSRRLADLFGEIQKNQLPPLPESVPGELRALVVSATAGDRDGRPQSMAELDGALREIRQRLYGARARSRWVWLLGAVVVATLAGFTGFWLTRAPAAEPLRPGDEYVQRALEEYEVFYNDKALSSLKAALVHDPDHPRAHAYLILFGLTEGGAVKERVRRAQQILANLSADRHKSRALLSTAVALATEGPAAARQALERARESGELGGDRELDFWAAELSFRSQDYERARELYRELLASDEGGFRGRIYDHHSAVLLYFDETEEAARIGAAYARAFPGEADALGVHATTLAAAGRMDQALARAREALELRRSEDTVAGLAKIHAYRGELDQARELYRASLHMADPGRRVVRRAALGLLYLMDDQKDQAAEVLAPCLSGGEDAERPQRGPCLWVAGLLWPEKIPELAATLETMQADKSRVRPPFGNQRYLAEMLRARAAFWAGGCILPRPDTLEPPADPEAVRAHLSAGIDFYAAYHLPFFKIVAPCEKAALLHATGQTDAARRLLEPLASPSRPHLRRTLQTLQ